MRGWLAVLHKARSDKRLLLAYAELQLMLRDFCNLNVLPFEAAALSEFNRLRRQKIRIGTMDLRIASVALVTQSTLLSRNIRDFEKVPGLLLEDWTR
jgi:tRNA(fMet)-specific endonuclease VapC